jgi:hypothetical protein
MQGLNLIGYILYLNSDIILVCGKGLRGDFKLGQVYSFKLRFLQLPLTFKFLKKYHKIEFKGDFFYERRRK